jgi:hypothetical protein
MRKYYNLKLTKNVFAFQFREVGSRVKGQLVPEVEIRTAPFGTGKPVVCPHHQPFIARQVMGY